MGETARARNGLLRTGAGRKFVSRRGSYEGSAFLRASSRADPSLRSGRQSRDSVAVVLHEQWIGAQRVYRDGEDDAVGSSRARCRRSGTAYTVCGVLGPAQERTKSNHVRTPLALARELEQAFRI